MIGWFDSMVIKLELVKVYERPVDLPVTYEFVAQKENEAPLAAGFFYAAEYARISMLRYQ